MPRPQHAAPRMRAGQTTSCGVSLPGCAGQLPQWRPNPVGPGKASNLIGRTDVPLPATLAKSKSNHARFVPLQRLPARLCVAVWLLSASIARPRPPGSGAKQRQPSPQTSQPDGGPGDRQGAAEDRRISPKRSTRSADRPAIPECVWLGRRVVSLLWRDDLDTAFRHLDLYDRLAARAAISRRRSAASSCTATPSIRRPPTA